MALKTRDCAIALACPFVYAIASLAASVGTVFLLRELLGETSHCSSCSCSSLGFISWLPGLLIGIGVGMANLVDRVTDRNNLFMLFGTTIAISVCVILFFGLIALVQSLV